jgi:hypothetical protein
MKPDMASFAIRARIRCPRDRPAAKGRIGDGAVNAVPGLHKDV